MMIKLDGISKTYKTKESPKVIALKNINLNLPSKGLILVVGDSGSGKTSLVNIIGGLDIPTTGQLTYKNKELIDYSNKKRCLSNLDEYKRNYVSFIFQDYNLIRELSVNENLKLGLTFINNKDDENVLKVLEEVGLNGYGTRFPNELSGGEQQRVAIARSLLKKAKVLIADEPTGNLDKNNSLEIIKLLKKISQDKLVIIVSHNEELVSQYADGIIRIEDGEIIENTIETKNDIDDKSSFPIKTKNINFSLALKMAFHNLKLRKLRLFITLFIMIVCYSIIALTISFLQYNHSYPHYYIVKDRDYPALNITGVDNYAFEYLNENNVDMISLPYASSKETLLKMGFEFYSEEVEFKDNCVYVSEPFLKLLFETKQKAIINGQEVQLNYNEYQLVDVIGNEVLFGLTGNTISGIYKSPYNKRSFDTEGDYDQYYVNGLYGTDIIVYSEDAFPSRYSDSSRFSETIIINNTTINYHTSYRDGYGKTLVIDSSGLNIYDDNKVLQSQLADDEVYVTLRMYNLLFGSNYNPGYFIEKKYNEELDVYEYTLSVTPNNLEHSFTYMITNTYQDKSLSFDSLKIKGIVISESDYNINPREMSNHMILSKANMNERDYFRGVMDLWIKTDNVNNLKQILKTLNDDYKVDFDSPVSKLQAEFETNIENIQTIMKLFCIAIFVVVILVTMSTISIQIIDRKKEIGILKSMGAVNREIQKIFVLEILLLIVPLIIISCVTSYIAIEYINYGMVYYYNQSYQLIAYEFVNIPIFIIIVLFINVIATLIPLFKISKITTIEAIRK